MYHIQYGIFSEEEIDLVLKDSLATFDILENFVLKQEQQDAIHQLSRNKDVLVVLLTGFGKSIIFRFGVRVKQLLTKKHSWLHGCCLPSEKHR